ncbi:MAG: undecaprenyl-phosphate glucose phosphotransferase [Roseiflexaceae bacterium]
MAAISSAPRPRAESNKFGRLKTWRLRVAMLLALIGADVLAINTAAIQIYQWRLHDDANLQAAFDVITPATLPLTVVLFNVVLAVTFSTAGLYTLKRGISRIDESFRVMLAITLGLFVVLVVNTTLPQIKVDSIPIDEIVLISGWVAMSSVAVLARATIRSIIAQVRERGYDTRRVVIVGARAPGRAINARISAAPSLGYRVQAFLSDSIPVGDIVDGVPVLGKPEALGRVVRAVRADEVIIALSGRTPDQVLDLVALAEDESVDILVYPDVFHLITNNGVSLGQISGLPLISIRNVALDNPINRAMKRALDLVVSAVILTFASPIMLLIALLIKLESPGPVFFVQERVGLDNKPFPTIKFRTMRADAPKLADWTTKNDPRVTTLGRFLRRTSLDELPQFINVIRGEMSVVGPRPEQPQYVERFSQSIPRYMRRHKQKAGVTGWAQANGLRGDTSIEDRTRYDLYYVENWSLLFDLKIIIKTGLDILTGRNRGA